MSSQAHTRGSRRQRGLSILESMVTVAVASTLSAAAAGQFAQWRVQSVINESAAALETDFQWARSEALARHQTLYWTWEHNEHGTCWLVYRGPRQACSCGSTSGAAECLGDAEALRSVSWPAQHPITLSANAKTLAFDGTWGTTSPAATVRFTAPGAKSLHQIISIMGRVRTCAPGGASPGVLPC
jgi:type IV fimbrial biogenesis protein FimT